MTQATPKMIDEVHTTTGLLVHHLTSSRTQKVCVRRMDHIHVEVQIPKRSWFSYVDASKANYITETLRRQDNKYIAEVIKLIQSNQYEVSPVIFNYLELNKPIMKYTHNVTQGTVTVTYADESRTFELSKLFKGAQYDKEYIKAING